MNVNEIDENKVNKSPEEIKIIDKECITDTDCVPAECCHPDTCVPIEKAPNCNGIFCTQECAPSTLDCGQGSCGCIEGRCNAVFR